MVLRPSVCHVSTLYLLRSSERWALTKTADNRKIHVLSGREVPSIPLWSFSAEVRPCSVDCWLIVCSHNRLLQMKMKVFALWKNWDYFAAALRRRYKLIAPVSAVRCWSVLGGKTYAVHLPKKGNRCTVERSLSFS